jgi:methionyl-tRNA formyltransferase
VSPVAYWFGIDPAAGQRIISQSWCRSHGAFAAKGVAITAMVSLNIVGFASGSPLSQMAMARLAKDHRLAAIVGPPSPKTPLRRLRHAWRGSSNPLAGLGAPLIDAREVERYKPDVIVVASFPRIIPAATLVVARIGALNMHASALPRHRGVDPIFWTYWDDDSEAAMSIHWINERIDAGDIAAQASLPLARGRPSRELYMDLVRIGVELLAGVLEQISRGDIPREPQDETRATYQSAADIARARIPFAQWSAERVWHVLSGLGDQRSGLVADASGRTLASGRATHYRNTSDVEPGRIAVSDKNFELHCSDGVVSVEHWHG